MGTTAVAGPCSRSSNRSAPSDGSRLSSTAWAPVFFASAAARAQRPNREIALPGKAHAAATAAHAGKLAMHMDEVAGSCRLLQRIDILRDREHLPGKVALESCERTMRGIRPRLGLPAPAQIVEVVHLGGIAGKTFRRRHLLKIELRPQPALVAKGAEPALSGEARAGQDDDVVEAHGLLRFESRRNGNLSLQIEAAPTSF